MRLRSLLVFLSAVLASCDDGSDSVVATGDYGGTLVIATAADADYLFPPLVASIVGAQVNDMLFERLAEPDMSLNTVGDKGYVPELAERWEWAKDSLSIAFTIHPGARWHDGRRVTARDVRFTYDVYRDPAVGSPTAGLLDGIDSVTVRDSATVVFWFSRRFPEQFFTASFQMRILPEHVLASVPRRELRTASFTRNPVGSGPFRFARWVPNSVLEVVADTAHYRRRPNLDRVIWSVAPDFTASVTKLLSGEADLMETLRPENHAQLARNPQLKLMPYGSLDYGFMLFNLREPADRRRPHPIFADRDVRRALTMAIDRPRLVRNVFDSLARPSIGPVTRDYATADTTIAQIPYDLEGAKRLLDSLGWRDTNGDGVREKNGRPLRFTLIAPSSSTTRIRLSVLLQEAFKQVGARVDLEQMEFNTFIERQSSRRFDAAMGAWHLDPSPASMRQTWGTAGIAPGGSNYGAYASSVFDAHVDSAVAQSDPDRAKAYYRRAYETIIADAPAIWLYEPKNAAGLHQRIRPVDPRADAWWVNMDRWSIPAAERIARDNVGPQHQANRQ